MDYKDIVKLLQNPDKVTEGLAELDTYNTTLTAERDKLKGDYATLKEDNEKRIKDLQDTNMKLYLRVTGKAEDDKEDDRTDFDKLVDKMKEGENS